MSLETFHDWLRAALPATSTDLLVELSRCHRYLPKAYSGMPRDAAELSEAMRALEVKGLVARVGSEWRWRAAKVVAEQQSLFA